jgi:hypothetical protein
VGSYGVKLGAAPDAPRWGEVLACLPPVWSASSGGLRLRRTFTHPLTATPARRGRCTVEQGVRQLLPRPAIRSGWTLLATEPGLAPALAAAGVAGPSCSRRRCSRERCFATALFRDSAAGCTGVCDAGAENSGLATNDAGCGGRTVRGVTGRFPGQVRGSVGMADSTRSGPAGWPEPDSGWQRPSLRPAPAPGKDPS